MPLRRKLQVVLWLLLTLASPARSATNVVSGQITTNTTLSGTNLILGTVTIQTNVVVTIDPGTQMLMNTGAIIVVHGQLLANGATNSLINFTRATTAARWSRIRFHAASNSVFRNCIFEYANSAGDHQDYYPTNCTTGLGLNPRPYHEAILSLATRLEFEGCTFRNLVGGGGGNEGDAIAIISDDWQLPGPASAHINRCRFVSIGQGIHTRYSHVLVENCFFSDKKGDNDDIDMYGESIPPPLIRYNTFLNGHEDKINPTRCSAIIVNNFISGTDDHAVVLRDKCSPIVMNNVIMDAANACIAVQNQCNAFIANNTLRNSARGIRFFDHTTRRGPPYCLLPGSGQATIVNNIIWDCTVAFELQDSPDTTFDSYANVMYCDVEGGQTSATVSPESTLVWGPGNLNADPQWVNMAVSNYHLRATSPCIDAGTNIVIVTTNVGTITLTNDFDRVPRPLDGNGDNTNAFDIGAFEFLLAGADSNADGIPDGWTWRYGLDPTDPNVGAGNPDNDPRTTFAEWVADTDPTNALSYFAVTGITNVPPMTIYIPSSSNRQYTLSYTTNVTAPAVWANVPGQVDVIGTGALQALPDPDNAATQKIYRVTVEVP